MPTQTQQSTVAVSPITAKNLGFQLDSGDWLFRNIDLTLKSGVFGMVGRNGSGKTLLTSLLSNQREPSEGSVTYLLDSAPQSAIATFSQLPSELLNGETTIAQFMQLEQKLAALHAILQGSTDEVHYADLGDDWEVESRLFGLLDSLRLPRDPQHLCSNLSGGQLAVLQLERLFESNAQVLILDEPTNHMDANARHWLVDKLAKQQRFFPQRAIMIVSHDRELLEHVEGIYHLDSLGLEYYAGAYSQYQAWRHAQSEAIDRKVTQLTKQHKAIERQNQLNLERAQQREAKGNRLRKSGSQAKIILDGIKNKAEQSKAALIKNQNNQLKRSEKALDEAKAQQEQLKSQSLYLPSVGSAKRSTLLSFDDFRLTQVEMQPLDLKVVQGERVHVAGENGSGKSLLLKAIAGFHKNFNGSCQSRSETVYLDQHFGLLAEQSTLLDALMDFCTGMKKNEAWLLLASIGFRRDAVHKQVGMLSGGEKMKLAMLMVSHREDAPLLLLDEPDNHLDIDAKEMLAQALAGYNGAYMVVSHDEYFVRSLCVDKTVSLPGAI